MEFKEVTEQLKQIPGLDNHNCFGCSPRNASGLQMEFFSSDKSLLSRVTVPDHLCGWSNLVHGGVISAILDEIMSWSAMVQLKKIILTKSITVDYKHPVYTGKALMVEGKVLEVKGEREALMEGLLYSDEGKLCSRSEGTFALFTPEVAVRMGVVKEEDIAQFVQILNM
jgi:uncharacterized protein (TIGR00369 family)